MLPLFVLLTLQDVNGEYRMAFTTHASADVGVCFTNELVGGEFGEAEQGRQRLTAATNGKNSRSVDLDIDIGADAVDYKWVSAKI